MKTTASPRRSSARTTKTSGNGNGNGNGRASTSSVIHEVSPAVTAWLAKPKQNLINGKWVSAASGKTFDVFNPADASVLARAAAGDKEDICWCLLGYAALSRARGQADRAATLLGAAAALLAQMGAAFKPFERMIHDDTVTATRLSMGDRAFEVARARGAQMALDDAAELAVAG